MRLVTRTAIALLTVTAVMCSTLAAAEDGLDEYQVKAAFLYNLAKFVQWPSSGNPSQPIVIGIVGEDPFGPLLDQVVAGKSIGGRPLVVRRLKKGEDARDCQIVFVRPADVKDTEAIVRSLQHESVLTVGETTHFIREGGHVRFYVEGRRVRFQINAAALEQAGLRMNSQLLSLAER